ncbi:MAG TPA: ABC transporter permease [Gemmatales bacterium]|nr:ABC transporter permease [Gemmatales bacterium]
MGFLSALRVALAALFVNKGRSVLTSLGIVIGIAAVIAMVAAGNGAREKLDDRLESVGKNIILIRPGGKTRTGVTIHSTPITSEDAAAIRKDEVLKKMLIGVAESQATQDQVTNASGTFLTTISGIVPDMFVVRKWQVSAGRLFNHNDNRSASAVGVIGETLAKKLFPGRRPADMIGQRVKIWGQSIEIVGVLIPKGKNPIGQDQDDQIFMPINTIQQRLGREPRVSVITCTARNHEDITPAQERITKILRERRNLRPGMPNDFDVTSVEEMAAIGLLLTNTLNILVIVIASISLIVGGIGIMNIMLVSVTERTREIGIRMAVGATPNDVRNQFLIESVVLALGGGLIGVLLGLSFAYVITTLLDWPLRLSPIYPGVAFGVAASVGVFFGYYPAMKASQLDPIEALRYE